MNFEKRTADFYDQCCEFFGDVSWAASCFIDADSQYLSYKVLTKYLVFNNVSLLDVGCGQGDFLNFIYNNLSDKITRYKGIDVSEKMIQHASKKFSNKFFSKENFLAEKFYDFDISIAVGTFNIR
jgi:ubiquinone/menaquinone biosynthesis C-methylase UbiE